MGDRLQRLEAALAFQDEYESRVQIAAEQLLEEIHKADGGPLPEFAITMGSGMQGLKEKILAKSVIPYSKITDFTLPKAPGHEANFHLGYIGGVRVLGLAGRTHYYDVADEPFNTGILKVIFPINVLASAGVRNYFVTNAAGGLDETYNKGDIMLINTHILVQNIPNPLAGRHHNFKRLDTDNRVERFPWQNGQYDPGLTALLKEAASPFAEFLHEGCYAATSGPTYESAGEVEMFRRAGAQAVGMSTAPEVMVGYSRGMRCVGFSLITNAIGKKENATNEAEVAEAGKSAQGRLQAIANEFFTAYYMSGLRNKD